MTHVPGHFMYDMDAAARDWVAKYPNVPPLELSDDPLPAETKTAMKNMDVQPPSAQTIEAQLAQGTDPFFGQGQPTIGKTAPTIPDTSAMSANNGGSMYMDESGMYAENQAISPTASEYSRQTGKAYEDWKNFEKWKESRVSSPIAPAQQESGGDYYNPDQVGQSLPAPAATKGQYDSTFFPTATEDYYAPQHASEAAAANRPMDEGSIMAASSAVDAELTNSKAYKDWVNYQNKILGPRQEYNTRLETERAGSYSDLDEGGGYGTGLTQSEILAANNIAVPDMPTGRTIEEIMAGMERPGLEESVRASAVASTDANLPGESDLEKARRLLREEKTNKTYTTKEINKATVDYQEGILLSELDRATKEVNRLEVNAASGNFEDYIDANGNVVSALEKAKKVVADIETEVAENKEKLTVEEKVPFTDAQWIAAGYTKQPDGSWDMVTDGGDTLVGGNNMSPTLKGELAGPGNVEQTFSEGSGGARDNGMYFMDEATAQKVLAVGGMMTMINRYRDALNTNMDSAAFLAKINKEKSTPVPLAPGYTWEDKDGMIEVFWSPERAAVGFDEEFGQPIVAPTRMAAADEVEYIAAAREMMQLKRTLQQTSDQKLGQDLKINFDKMDATTQNTILKNSIKYQDEQERFRTEESFKEAAITGIFGDDPTLAAQNLSLERETVEAKLSGMFDGLPTLERDQITAAIMGKFRNPVTGEWQKTIQSREMEAAITGIWKNADGSPSGIQTMMQKQFDNLKMQQRQDAYKTAGKVITDWTKGEPTVDADGNLVGTLDTLEKQALSLQKQVEQARVTGTMMVEDANGIQTPIETIEARRLAIEQEQADMLSAATQAKSLTDSTGVVHTVTKGEDGVWRYRRTNEAAATMKLAARGVTAEKEMLKTQGEQAIAQINQQKMADSQLYSSNLQAQADLARTEAEFYAIKPGQNTEQSKILANSFIGNINSAMKNAADSGDYEGVSAALGSSLPPTPSGLRWDAATGSFMQRAGFEGREMDFETQQWMAAVAPAFKARDRAEQATQHATRLQTDALVARQAQEAADEDFRQAMLTSDIDSAEEAIARQKMAETNKIETETKLQNMQMLFSLLQNPVQLGMAKRHGLLGQIESQLGFTLSNVPEAPTGAGVPNANEWQTMDSEQQAFSLASFVEGGGNATEFMQMIAGSAPAQMQSTQYATL